MYRKHEISHLVGYKTTRPKTGDWEWLWRHFRTLSFGKTDFSNIFFCLINNPLLNHFLANLLAHNKKMTEKSVFHEAFSPEMHNHFQSPVFGLAVFVPHWKWNFMFLIRQYRQENRYQFFLLYQGWYPFSEIVFQDFSRALKFTLTPTLPRSQC